MEAEEPEGRPRPRWVGVEVFDGCLVEYSAHARRDARREGECWVLKDLMGAPREGEEEGGGSREKSGASDALL